LQRSAQQDRLVNGLGLPKTFTGVCCDLVLSSACSRVRSIWRWGFLPFAFPP